MIGGRLNGGLRQIVRWSAALLVVVACGSRTGLLVDDSNSVDPRDGADGGPNANPGDDDDDVVGEGGPGRPDALPKIDGRAPGDANRTDCPDGDSTLVYIVTEQNEILSFFPADGTFKTIGVLSCPARPDATPFSMAVERRGSAFVLFSDGELFRVSTATGACTKTDFVSGQSDFVTFGMGFATDELGPTETLYVARAEVTSQGEPDTDSALGTIDTKTLDLRRITRFNPFISRAELTGTGDGRLFAFYTQRNRTGSFIGQIDTANARILAETPLPGIEQGVGWAFAFWGGDFYLFTAPDGEGSVVTRVSPDNPGNPVVVGKWPATIVGAGVSTCAPNE